MRGHLSSVRWLLLKDLQILRRSPLQATLLVVYPVLIALLVGFAISRDPDKPRVAFLNEIPQGARIAVGDGELPPIGIDDRVCGAVECVRVADREQALEEVRSGDVLAALILPADLVNRLNSLATLNPQTPEVEVIVNEEDPVKAQLVDDRIDALLAEANLVAARRIATEGGRYLGLIVDGGSFDVLGQPVRILGLRTSNTILRAIRPALPPGALRASLDRVVQFAGLARDNLDVAGPLVDRLAQPIVVDKRVVSEPTPPLEVFAVAVAATLTLAFVTVLLVAGSLALEREENAFPRLTRGLVSQPALLVEKIGLGALAGLVVTLLLLAGVQPFFSLEWGRFGLWLVAILASAGAFAAAGAALGAAAREVRTVSLLAFMVTLPIALLSLVPSGAVGGAVYDAIRVLTSVFPFKPGLDAVAAALDPTGASLAGPVLHLAALIVAYSLLARLALRRLAAP
ncbi:MAG TPA: ABC transporter permease [Solirubrobacterales bacterium]|nr:ABC transporter permease [Solirubrobacterales bacterium]